MLVIFEEVFVAVAAALTMFVVYLILRVTVVRRLLIRFAYEVDWSLGREPHDGIFVRYSEREHAIMFFGNNHDYVIQIPNDRLWLSVMPDWIRSRRPELIARMKRRTARLPLVYKDCASFGGERSMLYTNQRATPRVTRIPKATASS